MTERAHSPSVAWRQKLKRRGAQLPNAIHRLADAVFNAGGDGLAHEDCVAALPAYVDAEIEGARVASRFPKVKQHLAACAECAAQYAQLLEITLAEQTGQIPVAAIPQPDLKFLPVPFSEFVKHQAAKILAALAPAQARDLETISDIFFKRLDALGGKFILQPSAARALGLGARGENHALAALAIAYAATQSIVERFTSEQIAALDEKQLRAQIEAEARAAAKQMQVEPDLAKQIAAQFAQQTSADRATLRALLEQQKR